MSILSSNSLAVLVRKRRRHHANRAWLPCGQGCERIWGLEHFTPVVDQINLGCTQRAATIDEESIKAKTDLFQIFTTSNVDERYCEFARKLVSQLEQAALPCIDDHQLKKEDFDVVRVFTSACAQKGLQCLELARIGRSDKLWTENTLTGAVERWSRACDTRLAIFIYQVHSFHCGRQAILFCWSSNQ